MMVISTRAPLQQVIATAHPTSARDCHRGKYEGPEAERLATLKWAAMLGAAYVDIELEAAKFFFGGAHTLVHVLSC